MPNTFELIASSTVGAGGAANIEFTSITSTWTDLCIKFSLRDTNSSVTENIKITFNGVGGTSYSERLLYGSGSAAQSYNQSGVAYAYYQYSTGALATSSTFANGEFYIPNYAGSTNKSFSSDSVAENNATSTSMGLTAALFSNTSAITSIKLSSPAGTFVQYSTAYLYGVKNA
jgi:hypothetical protein